jgi:AraC-like DNA-binding protein
MDFSRIDPPESLRPFVDCFWVIQSDDPKSRMQKIVPDGYPEIIFHFGAPFRINLHGRWERQKKFLIAGQIKTHFFLENTGNASTFGIKLQPAALAHLLGINMESLTDKVIDANELQVAWFQSLNQALEGAETWEEMIEHATRYLHEISSGKDFPQSPIEAAVAIIRETNGTISVTDLTRKLFMGERNLERLFLKQIGISPKLYTQIIRFNFIFDLLKRKKLTWTDLAYEAGFYDQSHFIRNFHAFTGEDPSAYGFEDRNLANFFLQKGF